MMVQKLGFGESWINLVLECISTPTYLVLINGSPKGFFSSSRGLCQGDLISPYIFLLWVGLSSWLTRSLQAKRLSGAAASCGGPCLNIYSLQMIVSSLGKHQVRLVMRFFVFLAAMRNYQVWFLTEQKPKFSSVQMCNNLTLIYLQLCWLVKKQNFFIVIWGSSFYWLL